MSALGRSWSAPVSARVAGWTVAWLVLAAVVVWAQSGRDAYRDAYRAWRQADPNLEHDAATASEPIGVLLTSATYCATAPLLIVSSPQMHKGVQ